MLTQGHVNTEIGKGEEEMLWGGGREEEKLFLN